MSTFGSGDYGGYNDFAHSSTNSFWVNWNTNGYSTGSTGRVVSVAVRWGVFSGDCSSVVGHHALWGTSNPFNEVNTTNATTQTANETTYGSYVNLGMSDVWQSNASYIMGFVRDASKCSLVPFKDGTNNSYAGKGTTESNLSGGTVNWGGVANPGGLPVLGTVTLTQVFVRRGGAWVPVFVYVRRSGAWSATPVYISVRRSGVWVPLNQANFDFSDIDNKPMEALVDVGEGPERGYIMESGEQGWFGNIDPITILHDWRQQGLFTDLPKDVFTGRYNSSEPDEIVEKRLEAYYNWDQALRREDYNKARKFYISWQSDGPKYVSELSQEDEPEPILVGCNCC